MLAEFRRELASREQSDLGQVLMLTTSQFKQRVAQILNGFLVAKEGGRCGKLRQEPPNVVSSTCEPRNSNASV